LWQVPIAVTVKLVSVAVTLLFKGTVDKVESISCCQVGQLGVGLPGISGVPAWTTQPLTTLNNRIKISVFFSNFVPFSFVDKLLPPFHIPFSTDQKADLVRDVWGEEIKNKGVGVTLEVRL
jgi:hypothetical protein